MAKTNFYLVTKHNKQGEYIISMTFRYGKRLRYSTGQTILPEDWNEKEQRAYRTFTGYKTLNDHLDRLESLIKEIYRKAVNDEIIVDNAFLIAQLDIRLYGEKQKPKVEEQKGVEKDGNEVKSFVDCFNEYLNFRSQPGKLKYSEVTLQKFRNLLSLLKEFSKKKKIPLELHLMNQNFYSNYIQWALSLGKEDTTAYKEISNLKVFLRWAYMEGYCKDYKWKDIFKIKSHDKPVIALSEKELFQLYNCNFSPEQDWNSILDGMSDKGVPLTFYSDWEQIRDCYCFCAFTGIRFSDYYKLTHASIREGMMYIVMKKGQKPIEVFLNKYATEILEKYEYSLPKFTNVIFNRELHRIGQVAGLNQPRIKIKVVDGVVKEIPCKMYECLTHHVGRKTFVTFNLQKGIRHETLMTQTGHRKLTTLQRYIHVSNEMIKNEMSKAWQ